MQFSQKLIALSTAVCLLQFCLFAETRESCSAGVLSAICEQLAQYGVGADVRVALSDGSKLRGQVRTLDQSGFVLTGKSEHRIAYDQVTKLRLARNAYRRGTPDPAEVRRVALALNVGQHVLVEILGRRTLRGKIDSIATDHFTLRLDHNAGVVLVPYGDVNHLEKNLSRAAKIGIVVLAAVLITIVIVGYSVSD